MNRAVFFMFTMTLTLAFCIACSRQRESGITSQNAAAPVKPTPSNSVPRGPKKDCYTKDCLSEAVLRLRAYQGDIPAAAELANIYSIYSKVDEKKWLHWETIGAENGSAVAQYNVAFILLDITENKTEENRDRAMFWLHKAADQGDQNAKDKLLELEKSAKSPSHP
jgi:TPR repeat protein